MQTDPKDKKTMPEDFIEPTAGELSDNRNETDKEQDLDDLVHNSPTAITPPEEEIDADDAIHKSSRKLPLQTGNETDPDDLVHGN